MQKKLDIAVGIAILVVAGLLCVTLAQRFLRKSNDGMPSVAVLEAPLQPGKMLNAPTGYRWQDHPQTLVVALRYGCPHCERNMAFYQKLDKVLPADAEWVAPLTVFPDDASVAQDDLNQHHLHGPYLARVDFRKLHIFGTPTILLVDSQGTIEKSWIGELTEAQQDDVLHAISQLR